MSVNYVLTLSCLFAGLLFDPSGLLRMVLTASFLHECGHMLAFYLITHRLPHFKVNVGGISMSGIYLLPRKQENIIIVAGPAVNFVLAAITYIFVCRHASYGLYFFMAVNICIGIYNILPLGVLDGARLINNNIEPCKVYKLCSAQKYMLAIITLVCIAVLLTQRISQAARTAIILAPVYLIFCSLNG